MLKRVSMFRDEDPPEGGGGAPEKKEEKKDDVQKAADAATVDQLKQELEAQKAKVAELEEGQNPNWKEARAKISRLTDALKSRGVELDDSGAPKVPAQQMTAEDVDRRAVAAAQREIFGGELARRLASYDKDSQAVIRHFYDKITSGESVNLENIGSFIAQAEQAASVKQKISKVADAANGGGSGPRIPSDSPGLSDDAKQDLGTRMGLRSAKSPDKK